MPSSNNHDEKINIRILEDKREDFVGVKIEFYEDVEEYIPTLIVKRSDGVWIDYSEYEGETFVLESIVRKLTIKQQIVLLRDISKDIPSVRIILKLLENQVTYY